MYLSVLTKPDISYSLSYLSQFNNHYEKTHSSILRYLKDIVNYSIQFSENGHELQGFVDPNWGSNSIDCRCFTSF